MSNSSNAGVDYVVLALVIFMTILGRRGVRQSRVANLNKGERQRPILITWLDPVLAVLFVGSVLWGLITSDVGRLVIAIVGGTAGVPLGVVRARTMYVRAVKPYKSVVFRRSTLEYGLLSVLLVLRIIESSIAKLHNDVATYALTGLIAFALVESVARTFNIGLRYHRDTRPAVNEEV
jgi:hypothetical protein